MTRQDPSAAVLIKQVILRPARPEEAALLSRIARLAKAYWGYPAGWLDFWQRELTVSAQEVREDPTWAACSAGEPLGFYQLKVHLNLGSLEHLWVLPEYIGFGLGRALFEHASRTASSLGCTHLEVISDPHAAGFYRRMGAGPAGEIRYAFFGSERVLPRFRLELQGKENPV